MKVCRINKQSKELIFINYERVDEIEIFNNIKDILSNNELIEIGKKIIGPSEDIYECKLNNNEFSLIYDIDYGGCIRSENTLVLDELETIINNSW